MWSRLYRNHVIMPFPSYDTATNAWAPQADITWCIGPSRDFEFVRFRNRFTTEGEAVACALRKGQAWVDNRLRRLRSRSGSEGRRVIDMIGALKESVGEARPKHHRGAPARTEPREEKTFTFEQFKAAVAAGGLKLSAQRLQKSYAALVKVRNNKRWSWAETRRKVEDSQRQNLKAAPSAARRAKAARIPLTERDWRRIG